ncbi:YaiI/YqxD family protein [Rhizobiales bacterium]|uniref:YaiI/YqxD family protein n=1 Tax=Hongsoonwoonella zoysiae TaxID=2821844 RepID=UPI001561636C|nr:YaiI/YqxD family protein [Hongsoonwoonella zoysiae]NRG16926.1 YaiI/YqxD family protein [Hongsoonwoonella zoysiae]
MTRVFVDADACPVKEETVRVADRHGLAVFFVSNAWMRLPDGREVERVIVPEGPDKADDWIADEAMPGDVVVTADVLLAARCVKAGALVIGPTGKAFSEDRIGMALAMRNLNTELREAGVIREGGPSFSKADRSKFLNAMETTVRAARRISSSR